MVIVVLPLYFCILSCGMSEKCLVASREFDNVGTRRQFGIWIGMPDELWAFIVPIPNIGVDVTPSANVTDCEPVQGVKW